MTAQQAEVGMVVWGLPNLTTTEDKALVRDQARLDKIEIHATTKEEGSQTMAGIEIEELTLAHAICFLLPTDHR